MKPILFSEKEWRFESNGIGRLSDALSCEVTEERNGVFELEMDFPANGRHADGLRLNCQILANPSPRYEQAQPFVIQSISKSINNIIHIHATHVSYKMSYIPIKPIANTSYITAKAAISSVLSKVVGSNPFAISTDKADKAIFHLDTPASLKSVLYGMEGSLLDCYGGTWEFDRYYATLRGSRGRKTDVVFRYGKDLEGITYEESREEIYTGVLPYWKGNVQAEGQEPHDVVVIPDNVVLSQYASQLPYRRDIVLDVSGEFANGDYETQPTKNQVRDKGVAYLNRNVKGTENISIDISFVSLWEIKGNEALKQYSELGLCDEVTVIHEPYGINYSGIVSKTVYDVLADKYKSIEIGHLKPNIVDIIGGRK